MTECGRLIDIIVETGNGDQDLIGAVLASEMLPVEKYVRLRTIREGQDKVDIDFALALRDDSPKLKGKGTATYDLGRPLPEGTLVIFCLQIDENHHFNTRIDVPEFKISSSMEFDPDWWSEETEAWLAEMDVEACPQGQTQQDTVEESYQVQCSLPELMDQLNSLIGLKEVKEQVQKRINQVEVEQKAREAGAQRIGGIGSLHMLFTGNSGTGKTTIARMLGQMYQQLGVLPNGSRVVERTRGNLVGMYQGHSAKNVQDKFEEAKGGILFIDEAYSICRDSNDNFGQETIDEIVAQMENHRDSVMVILAGYEREMEEFLRKNSGLSSRIRNKITFPDYNVKEMVEIFKQFCVDRHMNLEDGSDAILENLLSIQSKQPDFGNARGVRNLFEEVLESQNERIMQELAEGAELTSADYDTIQKADLEKVAGENLKEEKTIDDLLTEMNALVGLSEAKAKIQEMVDNIQVRQVMKQRGMAVPEDHGTLHLIFTGNAGTGKTSLARLLGEIYTKLGVLQKNTFVEVSRADLVGQYQGHTAQLVMNKLEEADGGILFIDEAYTLTNGDNDNFGQEAIQTLVAELENRRSHLMVILAGYPKEMSEFLNVNSGLASRLSNEVYFADYTPEELTKIFFHMAKKRGLMVDELPEDQVREWIVSHKENQRDFGNARGVRNLLDTAMRKKDSRIAAMIRNGEALTDEAITMLTVEDLQ